MVERRLLKLDDPVTRYRADQDIATTTRIILTHTSEDIPSEYFYYSGGRFGRLTTVLEKASGKSFRALVAENIFKPVGMEQSVPGLNAEGFEKKLGTLAQPYVLNKGQRPSTLRRE
jgi:CubicO group peptidase (beta-lactamase class C family)